MLRAARDAHDARAVQIAHFSGRRLVSKGARAQLPRAVAAPGVDAGVGDRHRVRRARRHRAHALHSMRSTPSALLLSSLARAFLPCSGF